jgi:spore coat polysaccharide biosynthesis protein SpsF
MDVLDRFYRAAKERAADPIIRITGDCPLVDPQVISKLLVLFSGGQYDHVGVATGAGAIFLAGGHYPDGLDCECFTLAALESAWKEATLTSDREHVTPYIWRNTERFRVGSLRAAEDYGEHRWVVDNEADFTLVQRIYESLYPVNEFFLMQDVLELLTQQPGLVDLNRSSIGSEGYEELWYPRGSGKDQTKGAAR